jgi:hypothetical protein
MVYEHSDSFNSYTEIFLLFKSLCSYRDTLI